MTFHQVNNSTIYKVIFIGVTFLISSSYDCNSATITWSKNADGNLGESSSWSGSTLPVSSDSAVLNSAYSISSNLSLSLQEFILSDGNLIINAGDSLTISDNLIISTLGSLSGAGNISANTLRLQSGSSSLSTLAINETLELSQGELFSSLSGTGNLNKLTTGNVTIYSTSNSYSGNTVIQSGTLYAGADNVLSSTTDLIIQAGTFSMNGFNQTLRSLSGTGNLNIQTGTLIITQSDTITFSGNITGTGNVIVVGAGSTILDGKNGFTGLYTIQAGTLQFKNGGLGLGSVDLSGGNVIGGAWTISTRGLWYGTVNTRDDETTPNPQSSISTDLAGTEDSIASNTTEIWTGYIYDLDGFINLRESNDDESYYKFDGTVVLNNDSWNTTTESGNLNLNLIPNLPTGWHQYEMRFSNGGGGSGPQSGHAFSVDWDGGTSFDHPMDNGFLDNFVYNIQSQSTDYQVSQNSTLDLNGITTTSYHTMHLQTGTELTLLGNLPLTELTGSGNLAGNVTLHGNLIPENDSITTFQMNDLSLQNGANLLIEFSSTSQDNIELSGNLDLNSTWNVHIKNDGSNDINPDDQFLLFSYHGTLTGNLSTAVTFSTNSSLLDISTAVLIHDTSSSPKRIYITALTDKIRWIAAADGNWSAGANWAGGTVPPENKSALLETDDIITLDTSDTIYNFIQNNGQLHIGSGENLHLNNAYVMQVGLLMGTGNLKTSNFELIQGQVSLQEIEANHLLSLTSGSITSHLVGTASITKLGNGNVVLYGNNSLSGNTGINAGTLFAGADNILAHNSQLSINGGTFSLNGFNQTLSSIEGTGNLDIGSGNLELTNTSDIVFGGTLSGNGRIILSGNANVTLSGNSPFTGTFEIRDGNFNPIAANSVTSTIQLNGGSFTGEAWSHSSQGLWYGEVGGSDNETDENPRTSLSTTLAGTEDSIEDNTTEIWTGFFYDADGAVSFQENNDDNSYFNVDGTVVLNDNTWSNITNTGDLALSNNPNLPPGWHALELRYGNGSGGSGPTSAHGFSVDWNGGTDFDHPMDSNTLDRFIYNLEPVNLDFIVDTSSNLILNSLEADVYHTLSQATNTTLHITGNLKLSHWSGSANIQGNVHSNGNIVLDSNLLGNGYVDHLTLESGAKLHLGLGSTSNDNLQIAGNLTLSGNWNLIFEAKGGQFINTSDQFIIMTYSGNISGNLSNTVVFDSLQSEYDVSSASLLHQSSSSPRYIIATGITDFYKWSAGTDGVWDNASNWNINSTPSSDRSVKLDVNHTITLSTGNTTVNYQQTAGRLNISSTGNLHVTQNLTLESGSVTGTGNLVAENITITNGHMAINNLTALNQINLNGGTLSSNLHGSVHLIKNTPNSATLSSVGSTYTGDTIIRAGTLYAGAENVLPSTTTLDLQGGTFSTNGFDQTLYGVTGVGNLNISGGNLVIINNSTTYFSGNITGAGNLVVRGTGTFIFTGSNDFNGQFIHEAGDLEFIQINSSWNHPVTLAGGNFRGGYISPLGEGLWYGEIASRDDETTPNPMSNVSINLAATEDSINGNTTEVHTGYIFDPEGIINLRASNDDESFYKIDNVVVLNNDVFNETETTGSTTLSANASLPPGWHDFEMRFSNGGGGSGPNDGHGFSVDWDGGVNFDHPMDNGFLDRFTYDFTTSPGLELSLIASSNIDFSYLSSTMQYNLSLSNNASLSFVGISSANLIDVYGEGTITGNSTFHGNIYPGGNTIGTLTVDEGLTLINGANIIYGIGTGASDKIVVNGNLILNNTWYISLKDDGPGVPDPNTEYDIITYTGTLSGNITTTSTLQTLVPHWNIDSMDIYHDTSSNPKRIYIRGGYTIPKPPIIRIPGSF